ncbi:glycosyltransferase family 4 protein [Paenibacillus sp. EPM92]|uniref:glycosyltransferase family 4 protein n=1 Tax=Paenibacillus sp. EPM92 TaxID=1561195 RepID=UPI0019169A77|nr:glycosyltransferase family 4 protein [Paenibacillus sp. EPM92]
MKVLFLTNIPAPYRIDFFNELGNYCELTVLFERSTATDRNKEWVSSEVQNFRPVFLKGINVGHDGAFCPSIAKWLKKNLFDIFIVGGYSTPTGIFAIETLRARGIPFILNSDGGIVKQDKLLKYAIKKHYIGSASWWLSTGSETDKYLVYYGASKDNIYTYPFTSTSSADIVNAPVSGQEKRVLRQELGIKGEQVVLTVGQFINRKGIDVLLKAWKFIPEATTLIIVGEGPDKQKLVDLKNELNLSDVMFESFKKKEELMRYYRAADLFVLPTREDIWGLVVNEAMAQGLPVITTKNCVAGIELINESVNGCIVPSDDVNALAKGILRVLNDKKLRTIMSHNNLKKMKLYTIEAMAKKHFEILTHIKEEMK